MTRPTCHWCGTAFTPRRWKGDAQRFCAQGCRSAYWSAARQWVRQAVATGLISVADLKAAQKACTLHRAPLRGPGPTDYPIPPPMASEAPEAP